MPISEKDRLYWARQVASLKEIEKPAGAQITGEERQRLVEWYNERRRAQGRPQLINDEDEVPEIGFYRVAFSRRMLG
jgi:hypothetical protein